MKTTASILAGSLLLASTITLGSAGELAAQGQGRDSARTTTPPRNDRRSARSFRKLRVPGPEVKENVRRLTKELRWHKTLSSALAAGRSRGRPVVWIQALGDIDGFL